MSKKTILSLISIVAAIILGISLYMAGSTIVTGAKEQNSFDELSAQIEGDKNSSDPSDPTKQSDLVSDDSETEYEIDPETGMLRKYMSIYEQNPEIFGWLQIEGTAINYPVMFTPDDPQYYLHRSFQKKKSDSGTPFMDAACSEGCGNYIIYGHNMKNGTMFHDLTKYADKEFWQEHPTIRFDSMYAPGEYEVIAAFYGQAIAKGTPGFRYYQYADLTDADIFQEFVKQVNKSAEYSTGLTAEYGDELITLSTCSYHTTNGRFAVVARKKK